MSVVCMRYERTAGVKCMYVLGAFKVDSKKLIERFENGYSHAVL